MVADKRFEADLEEYLKAVIAIEKNEYHSTLQPFAAKEREIREAIGGKFREFHKKFADGYQVLVDELKHEMATSQSEEDLLAFARVDQELLKVFADPEALMKELEEGKFFYELLGFSEKALGLFSAAATHLLEAGEFERARDLLRFLILLAPHVQKLPMQLGTCYTNLSEYEAAVQAYFQAIDIDVTNAAPYESLIELLIQMHEYTQATNLCDAAMHFAREHQKEAWAEPLRLALEEQRALIMRASKM